MNAKKGGPMLYIGVLAVTIAIELACLVFVMTPPHATKTQDSAARLRRESAHLS